MSQLIEFNQGPSKNNYTDLHILFEKNDIIRYNNIIEPNNSNYFTINDIIINYFEGIHRIYEPTNFNNTSENTHWNIF
jgi:hypothetical protein